MSCREWNIGSLDHALILPTWIIAIFTQNSLTPFEVSNKYTNMVPNVKLTMNNKTRTWICVGPYNSSWNFLWCQISTTQKAINNHVHNSQNLPWVSHKCTRPSCLPIIATRQLPLWTHINFHWSIVDKSNNEYLLNQQISYFIAYFLTLQKSPKQLTKL